LSRENSGLSVPSLQSVMGYHSRYQEVLMGVENRRIWTITVAVMIAVLVVACAGAAPDTPVPDQATTSAATPTSAPVAPATSAGPTPPPTAAPVVTPMSPSAVSAKDNITLVVGEEPQNLNSHLTIGGSVYASITRANMVDPLTWQSGDDLRIVPTSATESNGTPRRPCHH
jgi:hypothetical protein